MGRAGHSLADSGQSKEFRLDGLLIENCHIRRCERDGIMGAGHIQRGADWYPSLNVVIRQNLIEEVPETASSRSPATARWWSTM